ncbi:DUF1822 family protein [Oscillatoria sp. FACHB-1407]|uniref:DUF1822 family protein n=1 Tax=Oscillatoria sp. FACHB-1407 TaxID=2692847 RepID=UPI0016866096|nr:DUF1822 family protein [Oscillatoria sp. FACHB-1407]MBD2464381.1 DUF1822 family protein [Oscillatoria sp. FACHB-1407]
MTFSFMDADARLDGEAIALDSISLSQAQIDQAVEQSQTVPADQQWQTYLDALALVGFEQWLSDRAPDLTLQASSNTVTVGDFKLCLLTMGSLTDTVVTLPAGAIDSLETAAQLYVLLEVQEEQEQVLVKAILRSDQLRQHQESDGLTLDNGTYALPVEWFATDANDLLLYLRCLEPTALPVGGVQVAAQPTTTTQSLVEGSREAVEAMTSTASTLLEGAINAGINAGLWLQNQLDAIAQELTWVLLPPPAASAMRYRGATTDSPTEQFEQLISELGRVGVEVPSDARGAYRELHWGRVALRLYAVAWTLPTVSENPEWSLLIILGSQSADVPTGVRLQIRDQDQLLVERVTTPDAPQSYLYGRVIGNWDEQFWVTVDMANGAVVTFPPFSFNPQ